MYMCSSYLGQARGTNELQPLEATPDDASTYACMHATEEVEEEEEVLRVGHDCHDHDGSRAVARAIFIRWKRAAIKGVLGSTRARTGDLPRVRRT